MLEAAELVANYVRACWIIKIRLISARRMLWAESVSLIQLESAIVQLRKICEGYSQLCLLSSHIEYAQVAKKYAKLYEVGKILKGLRSDGHLLSMSRAHLNLVDAASNPRQWHVDVQEPSLEDEQRVIHIWTQCGRLLHDKTAFSEWPIDVPTSSETLLLSRNSIRADHQWLWNLLWQQCVRLSITQVFIIDLGDNTNDTRPRLIKIEGFADGAQAQFDPTFLSDFSGEIDWSEYDAKEHHKNDDKR